MVIRVAYSFEVEMPDFLVDSMPEDTAKALATELAQNINFQEVQRAYTRDGRRYDICITKVRYTSIEDW